MKRIMRGGSGVKDRGNGKAIEVYENVTIRLVFFFSSRRRHTRYWRDWSSDVCSSDLFVFLRTPEAKEKLRPALSAGNLDKTLSAPVVCIVAHDLKFYDRLPYLFPHADARSWFAGNERLAETTAFRNGTLQGAYLIVAARSLGLDTGPMSGFDNAKVDQAFFAGTDWRSNFLVNLGYGDPSGLFDRSPRLFFDEACRLE